jgi:hypothetical protein
MNEDQQEVLQDDENVIRLIDGDSQSLTGWLGISILFSSPGNPKMKEFLKIDSARYIMPVWEYDELKIYNDILDINKKLPENILQDKYDKYGGIPRYIYENPLKQNDERLEAAIGTFNPFDILEYVQSGKSFGEELYSHRVLKMVPTQPNYLSKFYLDFQSKYIADEVFSNMIDKSINKLQQFFIDNLTNKLMSVAVLRGTIYEVLCQRNFVLKQSQDLKIRSLQSNETRTIVIPADSDVVLFKKLDEINPKAISNFTYYRPLSNSFGGLDAFIVDPFSKSCYGLQMTINKQHGIKTSPMEKFLKWLGNDYKFIYVFLTSPDREEDFPMQKFLTTEKEDYKKGSIAKKHVQFVCSYDVFLRLNKTG